MSEIHDESQAKIQVPHWRPIYAGVDGVPTHGPAHCVPRADFDAALELLRCLAGNGCHWCGRSSHTPDCRLAAFLKKWSK